MIIAGTGHRPPKLGGYHLFLYWVNLANEYLVKNKPDKLISGMALGWDQALAQAAVDLQIPLLAAVPFIGQESKWPKASQMAYLELLEKADEVHIVSDGGYSAGKMQVRNEWMVDNCDHVLALWDGTGGGTGNCIQYAKSKDVKIVNLWDRYNELYHGK